MYYGAGAGMLPTAMAVVSDMIEVSRNIQARIAGAAPMRHARASATRPMLPAADMRSRYYLRVGVLDRPGVLGQITTILGAHSVSIAQVIQDGHDEKDGEKSPTRIFVITHEVREGDVSAALAQIDALDVVVEKARIIRIAGS